MPLLHAPALPILVLCGVAGSGKTTVGRLVSACLNVPFADADSFHAPEAVAKMQHGTPLSDADRAPWLARLHELLCGWHEAGTGGVLACSALRQVYRARLSEALPVRFVLLTATEATLRNRLEARAGHFFPAALLDSQRATLEPAPGLHTVPTDGITPEQAADTVLALLG